MKLQALAPLAMCVPLVLAGCVTTVQSGVQPETEMKTCGPHVLAVRVSNTDSKAHRYTVSVAVNHDGMTETEMVSTDLVSPDTTTVASTDGLAWDEAQCEVAGVQTFS